MKEQWTVNKNCFILFLTQYLPRTKHPTVDQITYMTLLTVTNFTPHLEIAKFCYNKNVPTEAVIKIISYYSHLQKTETLSQLTVLSNFLLVSVGY
jgi:hypothetical protein